MRRVLLLVFASSLTLSSSGCSREGAVRKADRKAIEGATDGAVKTTNENLTSTGSDGNGSVPPDAGTKVPDDWPKEISLYPNAKVVGVVATTHDGNRGYTLTLETNDTPTKVILAYKARFATMEDMDLMSLNSNSGGEVLVFTAESGVSGTVAAIAERGKTKLTIFAGRKPKK